MYIYICAAQLHNITSRHVGVHEALLFNWISQAGGPLQDMGDDETDASKVNGVPAFKANVLDVAS